jgi:serine phosphatase RsbU (regulator of sigma subunit)
MSKLSGHLFHFILLMLISCALVMGQSGAGHDKDLLDLAVLEKDHNKAALHSYNLGKSYWEAGDAKSAQKYLAQSISFAKKGGALTQSLLSTHLMATIFYQTEDYSHAVDQYESAIQLGKKVKSDPVVIESLITLAKSHVKLNRYKKTISPLEEALSISVRTNSTSFQLSCYQLLNECHGKLGNHSKATEYRNLYQTLLTLQENEKQAAEKVTSLQSKIEIEKKENQNKLLRQNQKLKQAEEIISSREDSLRETTNTLKVVEESLKDLEEINHKSQLEIDLLSKERELANLRIQDQNSRLENEALLRNFILVVIVLGVTLIVVIVINYRKKIKVNKELDVQNKNIKSSINYAKRIQEAMLPKKEILEKYLNESFVLFKPRDVVSGDFFWFSPVRNGKNGNGEADLAFAAIDCTGHGVPGAFMSMIGINSLNSLLNRGQTETNVILDSLHQEIKNALQQDVTGNNDGMDATLCIYRKQKNSLEFSGAKSPLIYIQNNEVFQIKGDLHPIGGSRTKKDLSYKKHEIRIDSPTMVYLFTDGFRDQFGGEENQKFMSRKFTKLLLEIHHLPLADQHQKLNQVFEDWKGTNDQTDDVLVMGVRLNPIGI